MSDALYVGAIVDDDTRIRAAIGAFDRIPVVHLGRLAIQLADDADRPAVADRVLAAVTAWHAEIHRRAAEAGPPPELPPGLPGYPPDRP